MHRLLILLVVAVALAAVEPTQIPDLQPVLAPSPVQGSTLPAVGQHDVRVSAPVATTPAAEPFPLQVRPINDVIPEHLLFQAGANLSAGAIVDGRVQDAIVLPKTDPLAHVEVRIDCTTAIVIAEADRSSKAGYLSITLKRVLVGDGATQRSYPLAGFAKTIKDPFPGLPYRETDDLILVDGKLPVLIYLGGPISIPE